ncbi:MAG TPA: hypothetical protein VN229_25725 [Terriglobales bacterium]|nr:hypothetical protein [Terriglobales bacterium]
MCVQQAIDHPFDVSVFQGSAVTDDKHPLGYVAGERHDLILFLRQPKGNPADPVAIEKLMRHAGWRKSMLSLLMVLTDRSDAFGIDHALQDSYQNALKDGAAVIVCGEPA